MAMRVGESSVYPLRFSLLIYKLRKRKIKLSGKIDTFELLVNCLVDREDFVEKTERIKNPVYGSLGRKIRK